MKCIVVDDDLVSRETIEHLCELNEHLDHKGSFESALTALKFISNNAVDVIFLDVEMPEMTGMEMLEVVSNENYPYVVLTTSKKEYAFEAFNHKVIDYLLKPIDYSRFVKAVNKIISDRLREYGDTTEKEIFVKSDLKFVKIKFDEINYVEAMADYVIIHVISGRHIVHSTMKGMNEKLSQENFIRVHRSFIVNTDKIKSLDNSMVVIGEKQIPIGASYKSSFMNTLKIL
jgi:DNA-binding LytR/AlgR family response regulator